ncbi:MAG: DUF1499 domain-containing protein [Candidatus Sumerlaeia bacterium]
MTARPDSLAPCPGSPNCVSSLASDETHRIEPFVIRGSVAKSMETLRAIIDSMPRSTIKIANEDYLQAKFVTLIFRFPDDLELLADPESGVIHVRSAARLGYSDLGVNRRRVEKIRSKFQAAFE